MYLFYLFKSRTPCLLFRLIYYQFVLRTFDKNTRHYVLLTPNTNQQLNTQLLTHHWTTWFFIIHHFSYSADVILYIIFVSLSQHTSPHTNDAILPFNNKSHAHTRPLTADVILSPIYITCTHLSSIPSIYYRSKSEEVSYNIRCATKWNGSAALIRAPPHAPLSPIIAAHIPSAR